MILNIYILHNLTYFKEGCIVRVLKEVRTLKQMPFWGTRSKERHCRAQRCINKCTAETFLNKRFNAIVGKIIYYHFSRLSNVVLTVVYNSSEYLWHRDIRCAMLLSMILGLPNPMISFWNVIKQVNQSPRIREKNLEI